MKIFKETKILPNVYEYLKYIIFYNSSNEYNEYLKFIKDFDYQKEKNQNFKPNNKIIIPKEFYNYSKDKLTDIILSKKIRSGLGSYIASYYNTFPNNFTYNTKVYFII